MKNRQSRIRGFSMVEVLVVLSIIATVAALVTPDIAKAKRDAYVLQCKAQMQEIGVALNQYRDDHQGKTPRRLADLTPKYIGAEKLICPFTNSVAAESVAKWKEKVERSDPKDRPACWVSYQYISPSFFDDAAKLRPDFVPMGYSDVLRKRGPETPLLICRDHREPFSVNPTLGAINVEPLVPCPTWHYPEDDAVVLRWDGRVNTSAKGGTRTAHTYSGVISDLLEL